MYNLGIYIYGILLNLASVFNKKAELWVSGRKNLYARLSDALKGNQSPIIWFHAASLGEFEQGRPVIEAFRAARPEYKILVTFFSPSGYEIRKNYKGADWIFYMPLDTPSNARRFVDIVKPKKAVFIKYEFWLNHLIRLQQIGCELFEISAIFRPSQQFFKPYGEQFRTVLRGFRNIFVQNEESKTLLTSINLENVTVTGDTRFDRVLDTVAQNQSIEVVERFAKGHRVLVAGSTWTPDEELLARLIEEHRDVKFIIAPHEIHQDRIDAFISKSTRKSLKYTTLTAESDLENAEVLFIDTIGILSKVYRYGTFSYIGGGFGVGIHNTLEAAGFGLPLAFGPKYKKFAEACDLISLKAAHSINSYDELNNWFTQLKENGAMLDSASKAAAAYVETGRGATERIMKQLA
jgi:3-deoxy-D-manno-octulosonic-acid transferase